MRKSYIAGIATFLCAILCALLAFLPLQRGETKSANAWMARLSDTASVKQLSIPGTHDSGALHSIFDVAGKCQDLNVKEQLNIGVRFFDIRLQLVGEKMNVVHSFVDQALSFKSVMTDFSTFLTQNPSEFLIVSVKEDESPKDATKSFEDVLQEELAPFTSVIDGCTQVPGTVGEVRGKMLFVARCDMRGMGIPAYGGWYDSTTFDLGELYVQDYYCVPDAESKIRDISSTLEYSKTNTDRLVLNFTSCYLDGAFPPSYAGTVAQSINPWLKDTLKNSKGSTGVMIMDFVTAELAKNVYERNFQ